MPFSGIVKRLIKRKPAPKELGCYDDGSGPAIDDYTEMCISYAQSAVSVTQQTQANAYSGKELVSFAGSDALISSNIKELSKLLSAQGVEVKVWSFFSGALPGATVLFEGRDELEDIISLSGAVDFRGLLDERKLQLDSIGLMDIRSDDDRVKLAEAGLRRAYIVDDWPRLTKTLAEFEKQVSGSIELIALLKSCLDKGVELFACFPTGSDDRTNTDVLFKHRVTLTEFEGQLLAIIDNK